MMGVLLDKKLLKIEQRDTIVAEKLHNPIVISEIKKEGHSGIIREEDFIENLQGVEHVSGNYNSFDSKPWELKKKKRQADTFDALDKKIEEFIEHKKRVPPPRVIHDKGDGFKNDIIIPSITLIAGGKTLLEGATLRLV
jgi:hypothetical protein